MFKQFKIPLTNCVYSSDSWLLVTAAKDGYIAIHNAQNQHQPIKMLELEFPPDFVTLAFEPMNWVFASIGNNGSVANIWDAYTFNKSNQIAVKGHLIRDLTFVPDKAQLIILTVDCTMRFYDIEKKGGELLREVTQCHRGGITSISYSNNGEYFMSGGVDHMVKLWDADVNTQAG